MINAQDFSRFKKQPLVMATAYDFCFAQIMESAGVDVILVGDSLANVVLGLPSTRDINMDIMLLFVGAVARGARNTHITADMPFASEVDVDNAVRNAKRFMVVGAHSVKIEGAKYAEIKALTQQGIPVIGHLGLLPQTAKHFKQVGHAEGDKERLIHEAKGITEAGAIAMVLEHLDFNLATEVTQAVSIPTIGIGAGKHVDGQVLVQHDLLGLHNHSLPPFAKKFGHLQEAALAAASEYCRAVREKSFP